MRLLVRVATVCAGLACAGLVFVASCGSDTQSPPAQPDATSCNGFCIDAQTVDVPTCDDALLQCNVVTHLVRSCSNPSEPNCHGGDNPAKFLLHYDPETDLQQLVNVDSTERPDWKRVAPYDPAHSWMLAKLRNDKDAGVETAMPLGSDGDPTFAALVEKWILAGAPTSLDAAPPDAPDAPGADADIGPETETAAPDAASDTGLGDVSDG